jgi:hypothetical protein
LTLFLSLRRGRKAKRYFDSKQPSPKSHWPLRVAASQPGVNPFIALYDLVHASTQFSFEIRQKAGAVFFVSPNAQRFSTPPLLSMSLFIQAHMWSFQSEI